VGQFVSAIHFYSDRVVNYGTVHYSGRAARRLRQTNAFNGIVVVLYAVFASFYAALDWQALQPLA
jgi:adenylate cyclase